MRDRALKKGIIGRIGEVKLQSYCNIKGQEKKFPSLL